MITGHEISDQRYDWGELLLRDRNGLARLDSGATRVVSASEDPWQMIGALIASVACKSSQRSMPDYQYRLGLPAPCPWLSAGRNDVPHTGQPIGARPLSPEKPQRRLRAPAVHSAAVAVDAPPGGWCVGGPYAAKHGCVHNTFNTSTAAVAARRTRQWSQG